MKKFKPLLIILGVVALLFGLSKLPLTDYLNQLLTWFRGFGMWAPVLYFLFFTFTSSWLFPVFMLSICAGILFGTFQGFLIISVGNLLSCLMMFVLARFKGRDWFEAKLEQNQMVGNISRAIESEGWKMLIMLRAVPVIHMILLNVVCGLSKLRMKDYVLGTWVGMLPMLLVYAYMGSLTDTVVSSSEAFSFSGSQNLWFMAIAIGVIGGFSLYMKNILKKYLAPVTV